ncbi:hypothetical protein ACT7C1_24515 [Bacillus paranthracis]
MNISEYSQAMAIARTFVKSGEREGFWGEYAIELLAGCMMYMQKKERRTLVRGCKTNCRFSTKGKGTRGIYNRMCEVNGGESPILSHI